MTTMMMTKMSIVLLHAKNHINHPVYKPAQQFCMDITNQMFVEWYHLILMQLCKKVESIKLLRQYHFHPTKLSSVVIEGKDTNIIIIKIFQFLKIPANINYVSLSQHTPIITFLSKIYKSLFYWRFRG